ncbi:MAG: endonuclease MutS2, partial [Clostridium sp.]
ASSNLKKIRRLIAECEDKIKTRLEKFLKNPENKKYIQDAFVSERNGRYTVPIKASYKHLVEGAIIETSSKGSTVFIEPSVVSKHSAELSILKVEESMEVYKILGELTEMISEKLREVKMNIDVIATYDMIFAKAKYSAKVCGIEPKINDYGYTKILQGKYPLIKHSVPLDFEIGKDYRSLIITGPNAGGKTIVLKTIGLLTLAVQLGFHISAKEGTEISLFNKIFVDIGDNQSVENALSTFSSHIKNLAEIIRQSDRSTLLLFDEIGSGTEPNEGAAIAIAILEELYNKECITIATTHYGEIKNFSKNHPDFENAAMQFKKDTLDPLYKLKIGEAGDSNALYISKKMGLSEDVIRRSKLYIESKEYNYNTIRKRVIKEYETGDKKPTYNYKIGDRVKLIEKGDSGVVYKEVDNLSNLTIFYKNEFIKVHYKRVELEVKAEELYPEGYDFNQLFTTYSERKLEHDITRGSKKALKKIMKESRDRKKKN